MRGLGRLRAATVGVPREASVARGDSMRSFSPSRPRTAARACVPRRGFRGITGLPTRPCGAARKNIHVFHALDRENDLLKSPPRRRWQRESRVSSATGLLAITQGSHLSGVLVTHDERVPRRCRRSWRRSCVLSGASKTWMFSLAAPHGCVGKPALAQAAGARSRKDTRPQPAPQTTAPNAAFLATTRERTHSPAHVSNKPARPTRRTQPTQLPISS